MRVIGKVKNGNYNLILCNDGTKIRMNKEDCLIPEKPESLDYKITNKCDRGCKFCHENSTPDGCHGDIMNDKFIETLMPMTELAVGGGNPLEHPDLIPFLEKCKSLKLIPNMTVNQFHFMNNQELIRRLVDEKLIYGLGVSLVSPTPEFIELVSTYKNAVIHIINGVHSVDTIKKLYDKNLKILILGYKTFRRGNDYLETRGSEVTYGMANMYTELDEMFKRFAVVSFDNLALKQLEVQSRLSPEQWEEFYMGNDGTFTLFIDSVNKTYSRSSTTPIEERKPLMDDIIPMFNDIRSSGGNEIYA